MNKYILRICLKDLEEDTAQLYREKIDNYNNSEIPHRDSGFDLFIPHNINDNHCSVININKNCDTKNEYICYLNQLKINHKVQCSAYILDGENNVIPTGYYMYPRSSISKSGIMMANSVGIIDSGYRGDLIGKFNITTQLSGVDNFNICEPIMFGNLFQKHNRVCQLCNPLLLPWSKIEIVDTLDETSRGSGGFGSTGGY
jgi:dUTP pyrophosphatase